MNPNAKLLVALAGTSSLGCILLPGPSIWPLQRAGGSVEWWQPSPGQYQEPPPASDALIEETRAALEHELGYDPECPVSARRTGPRAWTVEDCARLRRCVATYSGEPSCVTTWPRPVPGGHM